MKNTIIGVYCHHDGYPTHMGNLLLDNYHDLDVWKLMAVGDMSTCMEKPEECVAYSMPDRNQWEMPRDHQTVAEIFKVQTDFEYAYLWNQQEGKWYYCSKLDQNLKVLTKEECKA